MRGVDLSLTKTVKTSLYGTVRSIRAFSTTLAGSRAVGLMQTVVGLGSSSQDLKIKPDPKLTGRSSKKNADKTLSLFPNRITHLNPTISAI
jgi:hypothetical protein